MKKIILSLFIGLFYIVIAYVFNLSNGSLLSIIIGVLVSSIFFYIFFWFFIEKYQKKIIEQDPKLEGDILSKHLMNSNFDGGVGYLLSDKFIFIPNKFSFSKRFTISYSEIEKITKSEKIGICICKIYSKMNKVKSFIIENDAFYNDIIKLKGAS